MDHTQGICLATPAVLNNKNEIKIHFVVTDERSMALSKRSPFVNLLV
jgi:hypothetical protein